MQKSLIVILTLLTLLLTCSALGEEIHTVVEQEEYSYAHGREETLRLYCAYMLQPDGTAELTGLECGYITIKVPDQLDGHPVTSIGAYAFCGSPKMERVEIVEGIVAIGNHAFDGCENLREVTLPQSLRSIGAHAFQDCGKIKKLAIPDGVTYIDDYAFYGLGSKTGGMASATVPSQLTWLGDYAYCHIGLGKVNIPDKLEYMGRNPFAEGSVDSYAVAPDHPAFALIDGVLFSKQDKRLVSCRKVSNYSYEVPQGIRIIDDYAFAPMRLEKLTLPDSLVEIGDYAFAYANNLSELKVPDSVVSIGEGAFQNHFGLQQIQLSVSLERIGARAFAQCNPSQIVLPEGLISLGDYAFLGCRDLASVNIPDTLSQIGCNPFKGCSAGLAQQMTISPGHAYLWVLDGCLVTREDGRLVSNLGGGNCAVPTGVRILGEQCFSNNIDDVTLPDTVREIGASAFEGCWSLKSIVMGGGVEIIGAHAFDGCSFVKTVDIPDTCVQIGDYAFNDCKAMTSLTIGNHVETIGRYAFADCNHLQKVTLPASVTDIGSGAFISKATYVSSAKLLDIVFTVTRGSYAESFCREKGFECVYPNSRDWLNN